MYQVPNDRPCSLALMELKALNYCKLSNIQAWLTAAEGDVERGLEWHCAVVCGRSRRRASIRHLAVRRTPTRATNTMPAAMREQVLDLRRRLCVKRCAARRLPTPSSMRFCIPERTLYLSPVQEMTALQTPLRAPCRRYAQCAATRPVRSLAHLPLKQRRRLHRRRCR